MVISSIAQEDHFVKKRTSNLLKAPDITSTEIGLFGGVSQYNGELNPASQFNASLLGPAVGLLVRRNMSSRWALRLNVMYGKLKGDDNQGKTSIQSRRSMAFSSPVIEGSLQFEFNFIPYCACDDRIYATPYIFGGIGGFYYTPTLTYTGESSNTNAGGSDAGSFSNISANIPFGFGLKYKLSQRVLTSLEWGIRKTYTDYVDGVSTVYNTTGEQFGNSKNKDFYSFLGIGLTIRVGDKFTTCHLQPGH